jgi:hypothetical protein
VLRALAIQRIASLSDGPSGEFTPEQIGNITSLLVDDSRAKPAQWSVRFDDLSASGSVYGNGPGIQTFVNARETRAATPNLYNVLLNADFGLLYDTPGFAWENRVRSQFSQNVVFIPQPDGAVIQQTQEPLDDLVLSSEVRVGPFDAIGGLPLLPFARGAFDTEITATPDRTQPPGKTLPHQALVQESVGLALRPQTGWLKDMRLGVILQEDLSDVPITQTMYLDGGLIAGLQFMVPIGAAQLISETDARWYVPDPDDRREDLGLRIRNVERLRVPITEELAVSLFVDTFVVSTKSVDVISGSMLFGAGLSFARIFPF